MQIEALQYIMAIYQCGSLRKASERLNTSHQNVSKVLHKVETELGAALFERTSRGITPTEAGEAALTFAQTTLEGYAALQRICRKENQPQRTAGKLAIAVWAISNSAFFDQPLHLHVLLLPQENMEPAAGQRVLPLLDDQVVMLAQKDSPLGQQQSIALKRLAKQPLVFWGQGEVEESGIKTFLEPYLSKIDTPVMTADANSYRRYIAQGHFIGLTSRRSYEAFADKDKLQIRAVPIRDSKAQVAHCLVICRESELNKAERCLVQFIQKDFLHQAQY